MTYYLSFLIYSRKEIETRIILERKSKPNISRFIDLILRLFNIMLGSNWLILPMGGQEYIDISRYYVVKSRILS